MSQTRGQRLVHFANIAKNKIFENERLVSAIDRMCTDTLLRFVFEEVKYQPFTEKKAHELTTAVRRFVWPYRELISKGIVPEFLRPLSECCDADLLRDLLKLSNECIRLVEGIAKLEQW